MQPLSSFHRLFVVFCASAVAAIVQTLFLREAFSFFTDGAAFFSLVLGGWFLLTGGGAFLGYRLAAYHRLLVPAFLITLLFLPAFSLFGGRSFLRSMFAFGVVPSPLSSAFYLWGMMAPFALISSALVPLAQAGMSVYKWGRAGGVYAIDTFGGLVGFILFSLIFASIDAHYALLGGAVAILSAVFVLSLWPHEKVSNGFSVIVACLTAAFLLSPFFTGSFAKLYPKDLFVRSFVSQYGRFDLLRQDESYSLYGNGTLLVSTDAVQRAEEKVHYAMLQREKIQNVLLLSGGIDGSAALINSIYNPARIDYLELDPALFSIGRRHFSLPQKGVTPLIGDARRYVEETDIVYDAVIIDLPPPDRLALNRYYTQSFFAAVKGILSPKGILLVGAGDYADYTAAPIRRFRQRLIATVSSLFPNRLLLPGSQSYLIASSAPIKAEIPDLISEKGLYPAYVTPEILEPIFRDENLARLQEEVMASVSVSPNTDRHPVLFNEQMAVSLLLTKDTLPTGAVVLLALITAVALFFFGGKNSLSLAGTGFSIAGGHVLLMLIFQTICGSLFRDISLLMALFMGGMGGGSFLALSYGGRPLYWGISLSLFLFAFPLLFSLPAGSAMPFYAVSAFLGLFSGGAMVSLSTFLRGDETRKTGVLYLSDSLGAAFGSFFVGLVSVPLLGFWASAFLFASVMMIIAAFSCKRRVI